jgi:hypothetical protein
MTPKDFTAFLASPESTDFSVEQLEKMLQQYPYTQSLRIAFLRKLKAMNHPNYEKHLHTTATYAYDRIFLRKYINKENIYVVEYPTMKVEVEQLETLDLMPLGELKREIDTPFLDLENVFSENENVTPETVDYSDENHFDENVFSENESENVTPETVDYSDENVFSESENESESENVTPETVDYSDENVFSESENKSESENENVILEIVEDSDENHFDENVFSENENIALEIVEDSDENHFDENVFSENESENVTPETVDYSDENVFSENESENIIPEIIKDSEETNPEVSVENHQSPTTNHETEMKHQKEIQDLILDSQRVKKHPPIEEDIDNLFDEEELEGLDDDIEFEFEIDKQIIGEEDDLSMFDEHGENHHDKHDDEHLDEEDHEVSEHENSHEDSHDDLENSPDTGKPLHEVIHEKIGDLTENVPKKQEKDKEVIHEKQKKVAETEAHFELSPDNVFKKEDLRKEGDLFFLDDRPEYVDVDDESELPLDEENETVASTENVNEIRATLSDKNQDKEAKKERIKKYLQRIAQIPAEENGIITETYADLLAKQGKIERSIKMYQQLILKNPQKKVYFAAKIKQLIKNI